MKSTTPDKYTDMLSAVIDFCVSSPGRQDLISQTMETALDVADGRHPVRPAASRSLSEAELASITGGARTQDDNGLGYYSDGGGFMSPHQTHG